MLSNGEVILTLNWQPVRAIILSDPLYYWPWKQHQTPIKRFQGDVLYLNRLISKWGLDRPLRRFGSAITRERTSGITGLCTCLTSNVIPRNTPRKTLTFLYPPFCRILMHNVRWRKVRNRRVFVGHQLNGVCRDSAGDMHGCKNLHLELASRDRIYTILLLSIYLILKSIVH